MFLSQVHLSNTSVSDNRVIVVLGGMMEIPGTVSLYCPLVDAKGTAAKLVAVKPEGYFHLEVAIKGGVHTMLVPIAQAALYFTEPEPEMGVGSSFEVER